ncbi:MAG: SAM-dependent methyltransferase [Nocardioidaceae bacterium]
MSFEIRPVGYVTTGRTDEFDSDHWGGVESVIEVDPERFGAAALTGLEEFSHVEVFFVFDKLAEREDYTIPRSGRGRDDLPAVGVFCDRGPRRPNRLGATVCSVVKVDDNRLTVSGLDALQGTPVVDIKPVMHEFLPEKVHQPEWVSSLMADYFVAEG